MLKNYTSDSKNTFDKINKILVGHNAKHISFEYEAGKIKTLTFALEVGGKLVGFKLPAHVDRVEQIFFKNQKLRYSWQERKPLTDVQKEQAYRTAWANIRDWLDAQMALIDTEQVKIEEVFLPYAVDSKGRTFFEVVQSNNFQLESGTEEGKVL